MNYLEEENSKEQSKGLSENHREELHKTWESTFIEHLGKYEQEYDTVFETKWEDLKRDLIIESRIKALRIAEDEIITQANIMIENLPEMRKLRIEEAKELHRMRDTTIKKEGSRLLSPRNKRFYDTSKAFVISALDLFNRDEELVQGIQEKLKEYTFYCDDKIITSPPFFLWNICEELESLPEFKTCSEVMYSDSIISTHLDRLVGTGLSRFSRSVGDYLAYLLRKQFHSPNSFDSHQKTWKVEFAPEIFDQAYNDLEKFFFSNEIAFLAFSELQNFHCDIDEIDLGDGLLIRKAGISDAYCIGIKKLLNRIDSPSVLYGDPIIEIDGRIFPVNCLSISDIRGKKWKHKKFSGTVHLIVFSYKMKKALGDGPALFDIDSKEVSERFNQLVTALRLFKSGLVGFNMIVIMPCLDAYFLAHLRDTYKPLDSGIRFLGEIYSLSKTEWNEFKCFWKTFNRLDLSQFSPLNNALRLFNSAYKYERLEDKFFYIRAFESIFNIKKNIGKKIAEKTAQLLSQNLDEGRKIKREIQELYRKRNPLVHGEDVFISFKDVSKCEDYLRTVIRKLIKKK